MVGTRGGLKNVMTAAELADHERKLEEEKQLLEARYAEDLQRLKHNVVAVHNEAVVDREQQLTRAIIQKEKETKRERRQTISRNKERIRKSGSFKNGCMSRRLRFRHWSSLVRTCKSSLIAWKQSTWTKRRSWQSSHEMICR